uniref:Uncharacterized protein n=1 Tax=Timema bartmani TaxID=61472 RepID=A0A7R9I4P6_9NEOP|nr:unnamed protein product [Timema bartmani]
MATGHTTIAAITAALSNNATPTTITVASSSFTASPTVGSTVANEVVPIFLQTKAAQGIAGVFVWIALFLTCQQLWLRVVLFLETGEVPLECAWIEDVAVCGEVTDTDIVAEVLKITSRLKFEHLVMKRTILQ